MGAFNLAGARQIERGKDRCDQPHHDHDLRGGWMSPTREKDQGNGGESEHTARKMRKDKGPVASESDVIRHGRMNQAADIVADCRK